MDAGHHLTDLLTARNSFSISRRIASAEAAMRRLAMRPTHRRSGRAVSTVAEVVKALEWAGVLTRQHRITSIRERCREGWRLRVIRISNAYAFRNPKAAGSGGLLPSPKIGAEL